MVVYLIPVQGLFLDIANFTWGHPFDIKIIICYFIGKLNDDIWRWFGEVDACLFQKQKKLFVSHPQICQKLCMMQQPLSNNGAPHYTASNNTLLHNGWLWYDNW